MNLRRLGASLAAGVVAFLVVFVSLTVALDPYVWPSALVALPIAIVLGGATVALTVSGLRYRAARAAAGPTVDGPDPARAEGRLLGVVAGVAAFVGVGTLAAVLAATALAFSFLTATLFVGVPVGLLAGVIAGLATVTLRERRGDRSRPAA